MKTFKLTYLGESGNLLSVGFNKTAKREFKIWDPRNMSEHLCWKEMDQSGSVILPYYDADTNLLYLAGKVIRFEVLNWSELTCLTGRWQHSIL